MKRFVRTRVAGTGQEGDARRPNLGGLEEENNVHFSMYDEEPDDNRCMARVTAPEDIMEGISAVGEVTIVEDKEAEKVLKKHTPHADLEDLDQPDVEVDEMINRKSPEDFLSRERLNRARLIQEWTQKVPRDNRKEILEKHQAKHAGILAHKLSQEEMKEILNQYSFKKVSELPQDTSTIVRCTVAIPSRGKRILQDQEFHAIRRVAEVDKPQKVSMPVDGHVMAKAEAQGTDNTPKEIKGKMKAVLDGRNTEHQELVDWIKDRNQPDWLHSV